MRCMVVREWNVRAFLKFFFFFLTNMKCKCHMQMPWLVLPMRYATIVPKYAIDRLLNTDLDVHFLWMQTKHDANLDFSFSMQMLFIRMQMRNVHMMHMFSFQRCNLWCKCLMQGWRHEVYSWLRQCMYLPVMQMSPYRDGDANVLRCKCLLMGMSWCKCFL